MGYQGLQGVTRDYKGLQEVIGGYKVLRGSLPKSGALDFATKNTFPLFFVGDEALVGIY